MQTKVKYTEVTCNLCGDMFTVPHDADVITMLRNRGWVHIEFHTADPRDYCRRCKNTDDAKERRSIFDRDFSTIDGQEVI